MSPQTTAEFFDSYADGFNAIYGNKNTFWNHIINHFFRKSMSLRFIKTLEGCSPVYNKTVLDIGCGPGHYAIELAKRGAAQIVGVDFAEGMIRLAKKNAEREGVSSRCSFIFSDFLTYPFERRFDYTILMGFMDYMKNPEKVIEKVTTVTRNKAFFSFPADGGLLAWQRKFRYKGKCGLFLYDEAKTKNLFEEFSLKVLEMERISRDYFITVYFG